MDSDDIYVSNQTFELISQKAIYLYIKKIYYIIET